MLDFKGGDGLLINFLKQFDFFRLHNGSDYEYPIHPATNGATLEFAKPVQLSEEQMINPE